MDGRLEEWLRVVVEGKEVNVFGQVSNAPLDELILYLKDGIVTQIFTTASDQSVATLQEHADLLQSKFFSQGKLPFTIRRVCELVYQPLKYYQRDELDKFNHALQKCINVESEYDSKLIESMQKLSQDPVSVSANGVDTATSGDVSMSKIPFLLSGDDELKIRKDYNEFLREIDSVMSINYEYDEDEDDDYIGDGDGDGDEDGQEDDEDDEEEEEEDDDDDEE